MPIASLLLRENSNQSLKALVERATQRKAPLLEYDLQLRNCHLDLILVSKPTFLKSPPTDEGFESDIDSLSIVSSDDSFTLTNVQETGTKTTETDSANGSASSDSEQECPVTLPEGAGEKTVGITSHACDEKPANKKTAQLTSLSKQNEDFSQKESHSLVHCICYTDVKFPNILVFVIKKETFVFKFDNLKQLQNFYTNFSALKAVTNQKTYNSNNNSKVIGTKFNLLQRTDNNGVTHIEITRETPQNSLIVNNNATNGPSSIISLDTPENCLDKLINDVNESSQIFDIHPSVERIKESRIKNINPSRRSESTHEDGMVTCELNNARNSHDLYSSKAASIENLLDINSNANQLVKQSEDSSLRKSWNSAENLLDAPKRPDRRRRVKYKAPQPPVNKPSPEEDASKDILSGQFVRVNVNFDAKEIQKQLIIKSHLKEPHPKKLQNFNILSTKPNLPNLLSSKPKQITYQEFKFSDPKKVAESATLQRIRYKPEASWTNSVPRLLKPRSKSETRNFTPMAYRYIDTTQNGSLSYSLPTNSIPTASSIFGGTVRNYDHSSKVFLNPPSSTQTISNRLFGLSPKLKEFGSHELRKDRWGSMSDICFKSDNNLKSVIKKDESKKKNEKKVTFSAYTTVQVV